MKITKAKAAKILNCSRALITKWEKENPRAEFFVEHNGKAMIDTESAAWHRRLAEPLKKNKSYSEGQSTKKKLDKSTQQKQKAYHEMKKKEAAESKQLKEVEPENKTGAEEVKSSVEIKTDPESGLSENDIKTGMLSDEAEQARLENIIYNSHIKKEKAYQEKIKTMELKKDLAPIDLVKHFFSFSENLIQRLYRRPHEISPQLESLYIGKEPKKAVQLIIRELESIVQESQKELKQAIKEEGYKLK